MRRITAIFLTLAVVFAFVACGAKPAEEAYYEPEPESTTEEITAAETTTEEPTTEETTTEETTEEPETEYQPDRSDFTDANASGAAELLEACYKARFDPESSGHILRDLNGDGQPEMLAFERATEIGLINGLSWTDRYSLYYYTVSDGVVHVADVIVDDQPYAASIDYAGSNYGESLEVHISDSNYICISHIFSHMAWVATYLVYQIKNDKFSFVKGISDPGYSGPDTGIYLFDGEVRDTENGTLYEDTDTENGMMPHGKYSSYEKAINGELNPLGFEVYNNHESDFSNGYGKYHIQKSETTQEIYSCILVEKSPIE